jgi:two-component system, sensor histidine kinase LadS
VRIFWVLLGGILFAPVNGYDQADPIAQFNSDMRQLDLTPYIMVLKDPDHALSLQQLSSGALSAQFHPLTDTGNSLGFSDATYWVKFHLKTDKALNESLILHFDYPYLDQLTFYRQKTGGGFSEDSFGDHYPFKQREVDFRSLVLKLYQPPGEVQTYYLRLKSSGPMLIPVSIWKTSAFIGRVDKLALSFGFYYGIMSILMLVAFIGFLKLKDPILLAFSFYLLSLILLQMSLNGFGFQFIWPEYNQWVNRINTALIDLVVVSGFLYCGIFFQVWSREGGFRYLYDFFILLGLGSIGVSFFGEFQIAAMLSIAAALLLGPIVIVTNIIAILRGYKGARLFFLVSGIFITGVFLSGLVFLGWIERSFLSFYAMQITSLFEIVLLGYLLIENISQLNIEKEQATLKAQTYLENMNQNLEQEVASRTRELNKKNQMLMELSLLDSMSGLLNHNASLDQIKVLTNSAIRYGRVFAVIMIDIDHFKSINDRYGHPSGDLVIQQLASLLKSSIRASDICGRYGGEEFILLLPETDKSGAVELAEQIRLSIMQIQISEIENHQITASFGVAVFDHENQQADMISKADQALYEAKRNGRNQVVARSAVVDDQLD